MLRRILVFIALGVGVVVAGVTAVTVRFARSIVTPPRATVGARSAGDELADERFADWFYRTPDELAEPWSEVSIDGPLGVLPAWHIAPVGAGDRWVIHVHGRTAQRAETLRGVTVASGAGWQSLVVSYRNDRDAPSSTDRRYGLGSTEWRDILPALDYAAANGATDVVLFGWSMGGIISLRTAVEASARATVPVSGIILDSPALSWPIIIGHHADLLRLPRFIAHGVTTLLQSRWAPALTGVARPLRWRDIDGGNLVARAGKPTIVLASAADAYVPVGPARQLAKDLPELVEYHEFANADHVRLWNSEPERWEQIIGRWLSER